MSQSFSGHPAYMYEIGITFQYKLRNFHRNENATL